MLLTVGRSDTCLSQHDIETHATIFQGTITFLCFLFVIAGSVNLSWFKQKLSLNAVYLGQLKFYQRVVKSRVTATTLTHTVDS